MEVFLPIIELSTQSHEFFFCLGDRWLKLRLTNGYLLRQSCQIQKQEERTFCFLTCEHLKYY